LSPVFNIRGATNIPVLQQDNYGRKSYIYRIDQELSAITKDTKDKE
jgi:hypothetical protein